MAPAATSPTPTSSGHPATPAAPSTLLIHRVTGIALGDHSSFDAGLLTIGAESAAVFFDDPAFADVRFHTASPGGSVRIVKLLDVVEPRSKGPGGGAFPGFVGPARPARSGPIHVLRGAAVMAAGYLPRNQEGVVDMSGPAAALSPYATTHNLIVEFDRADDATWEDVDRALRNGLLSLAVHLADAAVDTDPDDIEEWPSPDASGCAGDLPRVGAITNLQTQGSFKDVFVHGESLNTSRPILIDPGEVDDGAVVGGQFGHPGLRNSTWMHQNNPVVADLRARHGRDLVFAGLILCPEPVDQGRKEQRSAEAAQLCVEAGFDAAIVTKEGGGNADADISFKLDALARLGITGVGIFAELSGPDGTGPPVVSPPRVATAMISTGNYDERLHLPAVDRVIGGDRVDIADAAASGELDLPTAAIHGSLSPLGWGRLTAQAVL